MAEKKQFSQCWLHIGTEKTGTTTIQTSFLRNRAALLKRGVLYPSSLANVGHDALVTFAANDRKLDDLRRIAGVLSGDDVGLHRDAVMAQFACECAEEKNASTLVLSSEHCHSRLTSVEEIERLRLFLEPWCDHINVIVYLRPQHELAISTYSTEMKSGRTIKNLFPQADWRSDRYNYNRLLTLWATVFGKQNLRPRIFTASDLLNGDVFQDFAHCVGVDVNGLDRVVRSNPSLTPEALELLRLLNPHMPRFIGHRISGARVELIQIMEKVFAGQGGRPARAAVEQFYRRFEHSNANACANYFPGRKQLFEVDFSLYPEHADSVELSLDQAAAMFSLLWTQKFSDIENHVQLEATRPADSNTVIKKKGCLRRLVERLKSSIGRKAGAGAPK